VIELIRQRLAAYVARDLAVDGRPRAGVLLPLYDVRGELHVVLTRRTDRVEHHKGEISFPGGSRDPEDADLVATALREGEEEIGLRAEHVEIVGRVDDIVTVSQFHVSAYVGALAPLASPYVWRPHPEEVAEVIEVPLTHLMDPASLVRETVERRGSLVEREGYRYGDHLIWGATARILQNFLAVVAD
jgi:8-oxo-dGTP pyrophosphatase MutT (NUDIX family)